MDYLKGSVLAIQKGPLMVTLTEAEKDLLRVVLMDFEMLRVVLTDFVTGMLMVTLRELLMAT